MTEQEFARFRFPSIPNLLSRASEVYGRLGLTSVRPSDLVNIRRTNELLREDSTTRLVIAHNHVGEGDSLPLLDLVDNLDPDGETDEIIVPLSQKVLDNLGGIFEGQKFTKKDPHNPAVNDDSSNITHYRPIKGRLGSRDITILPIFTVEHTQEGASYGDLEGAAMANAWALNYMIDAGKKGRKCMILYPPAGEIHRSMEDRELRPGIGRLLQETGTVVLPVGIEPKTWVTNRREAAFLNDLNTETRIGTPITAAQFRDVSGHERAERKEDARRIAQFVGEAIKRLVTPQEQEYVKGKKKAA